MLRIGIDGRAFASPAPGVRRYVAGLVRALLALGEPLEVVALGGRDSGALPAGTGHIGEPPHPPTNLGWTLVGLPRAAWRARVDVIHAPAYTAPFWSPVPTVLTIHDVSYELHPQWYPYRRDWMRRAFYRHSARAAAHILTVSRFSACEIAGAYGIAPDRITVAPLGVDEAFAARDTDPPGELPAGVVVPYLLHVGDLHERRNLAMLVDALLAARRHFGALAPHRAGVRGGDPALAPHRAGVRGGDPALAPHRAGVRGGDPALPAVSLVLAGTDRGVGAGLTALAAEAGAADAVVLLGAVSEPRLRALYRRAAALVYPSLYEGFGLPLIEAMASGTPVIASNVTSIPEVVGDAGLLLDPQDRKRWTEAIVAVINDDSTRRRMRAAGLRRAADFTWARTARLTLDVYRRVLARPR